MKLTAAGKRILLQGAPDAVRPLVQRWFGRTNGSGDGSAIEIEPRRVLALTQHYRDRLQVSPEVQAWQRRGLDAAEQRISRRCREYRGGYQARAVARMVRDRSHGCWIDAGGGKTVIALEVASLLGPTLLVVPPVIWRQAYVGTKRKPGDLAHYPHLAVADATDGNAEDRKRALRQRADLYVVSPFTLGGLRDDLRDLPLAAIIADESSIIRNPGTTVADVFRSVLAGKTDHKYALSANPAPSDVGELWSQIEFLRPNHLGSWKDFASTYGQRTRWGYEFRDVDLAVQALERVRSFSTLLPQEQFWNDRPSLSICTVPVTLGRRERAEYEAMDKDFAIRLGTTNEWGEAELVEVERELGKRTKLREITSGFVYREGVERWIGERSKLRAALGLIAAEPREQWIVWGQFSAEMAMIEAVLHHRGIAAGYYSGDNKESRQHLRRFTEGRLQILISNTASLGHGVRLETACRAIYTSLPDSADQFYQSLRRTYRPPQTRDCVAYLLAATNTIDVDQLAALRRRMAWRQRFEQALAAA